jgi:Domain of unknown function (DUF5667)
MADLNQVRRRAEEFARLADGAAPPPNPVQDPEFARALQLVEAMREAGAVRPSAEFAATLRQQLIDEAAGRVTATPNLPAEPELPDDEDGDDAGLATATPLHRPRHRRGRLIAAAAAFVVLAGGIGSAAAAQQSMPGDALYALKRGLEAVATKVSVTDDSRGRRELSHALARLTESEKLVAANAETTTITDTLGDFSTEARSGGDHLLASFRADNDASAVDKIYRFAEEARARLLDLAGRAPAAVQPAIAEALRTAGDLVQQAATACPTCVSPKTTTIPPGSVSATQPSQSTDPSIQNPKPSQPVSTGIATPGIPHQPAQTPAPTLPTTSSPGNPKLLPSLPTTGLPSLPTSGLPTVSLPLPSVTLPALPLLDQPELQLAPHTSLSTTSATSSSATPSK